MIQTAKQLMILARQKAKGNSAKIQMLTRYYAMERFLERLSFSAYRNSIILKGGVLVSAIVGFEQRATIDMDIAVKNLAMSEENVRKTVEVVAGIQINDGISFSIKNLAPIMDTVDNPGIRVTMEVLFEKMRIPLKIDFSSGDIITPHEISYPFQLLFENRTISVMAYNIETLLAEKIETFLSRGTANSRMRDFYDMYSLMATQSHNIDNAVLKEAFANTCDNRKSSVHVKQMDLTLQEVENSQEMVNLWKNYQRKFDYAAEIDWEDVILSLKKLCDICR